MTSQSLKLQVALNAVDKLTGPLQSMLKGSTGLAKGIKGVKDQLADLNTQQKRLDGFTKSTEALNANRAALDRARDRVRELRAEVIASDDPHKKLTDAYRQARREAMKLERHQEALVRAHDDARRNVERLGTPINRLADRQRTLSQEIAKANDHLRVQGERLARVKRAEQQWKSAMEMRAKLESFGVRAMAGGAAAGAATLVPIRAYAEAEDAATQLEVAMMKAGGKVSANFERINALAMQLGNRLPGTTAEIQGMMTALIRQGMSEQAILGGLGEAAALLGVQLKLPFEQAAEFASKMQDATRASEREMLGLMDVIQRAFYQGVDSNNMLAGFTKLSPALDTIRKKGLDAARALAPILVMADQSGMDGSAAGNAVRKVLQASMNTEKIGKALAGVRGGDGKALRLDFTDGKGEFAGLDRMFSEMAKLRALTTEARLALLKDVYGDDAETLQVVSLLIDKGKAGYDEVLRKMQDQASLQQRVDRQLGTIGALWEAATGTFTNALSAIGKSIAPEIKAMIEGIGRLAESVQKWAGENPGLAAGLMKLSAAMAGILTLTGGLALAASALLGPFAMAKIAIGVMGGAGLKMIALSVPLLAAIGGIAWAAYEIYENWDGIAAWFRQQWEAVASFMSGLAARFEQIGLDVMLGLSRGIRNAAGAVKDAVFSTAENVTNWFKSKLGINSPSRVFAELGGFTMAGLVQGLGKGETGALKAIGEFSRRFATTAALGMAGAGIATAAPMPTTADRPLMASSPRTLADPATSFHYTINIDARGGGDEKAIRRVVQSELERQRNYLAARFRARLGDVD